MMHEFLVLFWLTVGLIQAHANDDFLFNDEGYPSTASGSISLSDDISSLWSTQDLASDISPAPFFIADDNSSCSADNSRGFFTGRKRIRSIICDGLPGAGEDQSTTRDDDQPATTDPDLEDLIRSLESPWDGNGDGSSASDYNGSGLQRASLCPDLVNIGQVLPVCSSGDKKDVNYAPFTGEVKLEWCTLGMGFPNIDHVFVRTLY